MSKTNITKNEKFIVYGLVLLSISRLALFSLDKTRITLYYFFGILILYYALSKSYRYVKRIQYINLTVFVSIISSFFLSPTPIWNSIIHLYFYVFTTVSFMSIMQPNRVLAVKTNKFIVYLFSMDVLISYFFYRVGYQNEFTQVFFPVQFENGFSEFAGLTTEPSYFAFICSICILNILHINKIVPIATTKELNLMLSIYIIAMIISKTSFGYILLVFILYSYSSAYIKKNIQLIVPICLILLAISVLIYSKIGVNQYVHRSLNVVSILFSSGSIEEYISKLNASDGSAAFRLLPSYEYFRDLDIFDIKTWLGHGIGQGYFYFSNKIFTKGDLMINLGFFPAFFYDAGIIGAVSIISFIIYNIKFVPKSYLLIFLLLATNSNISTQIFNFFIIDVYWLHLIIKQHQNESTNRCTCV